MIKIRAVAWRDDHSSFAVSLHSCRLSTDTLIQAFKLVKLFIVVFAYIFFSVMCCKINILDSCKKYINFKLVVCFKL